MQFVDETVKSLKNRWYQQVSALECSPFSIFNPFIPNTGQRNIWRVVNALFIECWDKVMAGNSETRHKSVELKDFTLIPYQFGR